MLLSCRMLNNVAGVNAFEFANQVTITEGDTPTLFLQLIDLGRNKAAEGFVPAGLRYVPAEGAQLQVTLDSIDSARKVVRSATQPFPSDPSIWAVQLVESDKVRGTVSVKLALTEEMKVTYGLLQAGLRAESLDGMTRY